MAAVTVAVAEGGLVDRTRVEGKAGWRHDDDGADQMDDDDSIKGGAVVGEDDREKAVGEKEVGLLSGDTDTDTDGEDEEDTVDKVEEEEMVVANELMLVGLEGELNEAEVPSEFTNGKLGPCAGDATDAVDEEDEEGDDDGASNTSCTGT